MGQDQQMLSLYEYSLGYIFLPPDAWVRISRCCLCTDNHLGISACHLTHGSGSADVVRPKESRPEEADISGKGADDHIGLRLSIRLVVSKWRGADNHKASLHVIGLTGHDNRIGWSTKARLLLLHILNLRWGTQTWIVLPNCETKIVSVFFY